MGALLLMLSLALLTGCAAGGKVEAEVVARPMPVHDGPTVTRFEDGREGFVLTETSTLDTAARHDFDQAVERMTSGDFDQAIGLFEGLLESSPQITAPHINVAIAYRHVDQPALAEEHLKTALTLFPGHPVASNEYGLLLRKAGRFDEARVAYEEALSLFPEYFPVRRNLGILCDLYLNDQQCALTQYELYNDARPGDEQVKLWVSELRLRLGQ
jgi:Flp pilus assembly protein TadD